MPLTPRSQHHDIHSAFDAAWSLLLATSAQRRSASLPAGEIGLKLTADGELLAVEAHDPSAQLLQRSDGAITMGPNLLLQVRDFVELYLPLLAASTTRPMVMAHLGQSIDAQIATESGDSCYVNGRENLTHLHRMRALCDAIVVGAETVVADDPRLTTRMVDGPNPVRIVIDPQRRVPCDRRVFTDGEAPTLVACDMVQLAAFDKESSIIGVPRNTGGLSLDALLASLQRRGLHALFVEGGGITVTHWIQAGLLDHLQIATAPVIIGAGRAGLRLPSAPDMKTCLRPAFRVFRMGKDLLWDFDMRMEQNASRGGDEQDLIPLRLL